MTHYFIARDSSNYSCNKTVMSHPPPPTVAKRVYISYSFENPFAIVYHRFARYADP